MILLYLILSFVTWFIIVAIADSAILYPWLNDLVDDRFTGLKHFWSACVVDRPRKDKNLAENIEKYSPEGDFTEEEKLEYLVSLTGVFPINAVVTPRVRQKLDELYIPPISEFDPELGVTWFIPRECKLKKSKNLGLRQQSFLQIIT